MACFSTERLLGNRSGTATLEYGVVMAVALLAASTAGTSMGDTLADAFLMLLSRVGLVM
jgi:Flp pilus assembly pilin Flp